MPGYSSTNYKIVTYFLCKMGETQKVNYKIYPYSPTA